MREFDTPEEAALAGWSHTPSANARVVELRHDGDVALVVIQVDGAPGFHDRDACTCERLGRVTCDASADRAILSERERGQRAQGHGQKRGPEAEFPALRPLEIHENRPSRKLERTARRVRWE